MDFNILLELSLLNSYLTDAQPFHVYNTETLNKTNGSGLCAAGMHGSMKRDKTGSCWRRALLPWEIMKALLFPSLDASPY